MKSLDKKNKRTLYYLILIFLFIAIGITILGIRYYRSFEKQYRTEVEHQLTAIADLKIGELVQWRKERLGDANLFYKNEIFTEHVIRYFKDQNDLDAKKRILMWMEKALISYDYNGIFLIDTQFTKRIVIPEKNERIKALVSQNNYDSLKSGRVVFEDFYRDDTLQKIFLKIFVPVLDDKKKITGIVELRIDPQVYIYPLINKWPLPSKTSETMIARREGNDAVFLNQLKIKENITLNFRVPLVRKDELTVRAVMGETGIVTGVDYNGEEVIGDVRPVPDSPWYMITKMNISEVYAPMNDKLWNIIFLVIAFLFATGAGISLIRRQQKVKFFKEKSDAADALIIANKELDFQNKEKEKRADELIIANKELAFQNDEKEKRIDELIIANKELAFQNEEKEKRADELIIANKELVFQNEEKEKRAAELVIADKELDYQNVEKEKRAAELAIADKEVIFQHEEKEKQLTANKELEAFSYSVSHDLRAPLRHIGGFVDLLIKNSSSQLDETGLRYLNIISESSLEMGNLIDALLTFSRLSRTEMKRTKINSKDMVTRVLKTFSDELVGRNVEINISELPDIKGDESLINQVWANLISNAIKYTRNEEKAVIDIGGKTENDETIFYIKDNGAGFDMKYSDKLFGVFQRFHKARDFEGIGIGLANVNRIVVRHGGKCWAESEVGKGATFFFSKPNNY
jgi:signal transduction histidine kinase